ncbi:hypothetical protein GPALN_003014 [Globodera pallida]|nr:hypothetical protein GPALN_003014 [Globodera pallida]
MSDHPREQSRMRHIFVCNDILLDIFPFIEPAKVGLKLALLSIRFDALVDLHFKERKRALGHMQIQPLINGAKIEQFKEFRYKKLPFPQQPPPDNIIGFTRLEIYYIDHKLFAFLRLIERFFDAGIKIALCGRTIRSRNWYCALQELWPLLAPHILELWIDDNEIIDCLFLMRGLIAPTILRDCANLRLIGSWDCDHFPGTTTVDDDDPVASCAEAMSKWLHTPRGDGRPKVLYSGVSYGEFCWRVEKIKEAFIDANSAVNYIIFLRFASSCGAVQFSMDNRRTRERLALEFVDGYKWLLLARCPIGVDDKWAQWKREEIARSNKDIGMNLITIW